MVSLPNQYSIAEAVVIYGADGNPVGSTASPIVSREAPVPTVAAAYRSAVTAADVLASVGTVTCTKQAGGSATAGVYNVAVVPGNPYGRGFRTAGNTTVTTETTNLTVRAAFAAVTGATFYDIYVSTDANPKWVGRITEAQRGTGIKITAVGVTGAGGTAGAVDVEVPGTGLQAVNTAVTNNAYVIPAEVVDTTGYRYVDFDLAFSRTGDAVAPVLTVAPFFLNAVDSAYFQGESASLAFGGASGQNAMRQRLRVESRGSPAVALLVLLIAGTGASLTVTATRS